MHDRPLRPDDRPDRPRAVGESPQGRHPRQEVVLAADSPLADAAWMKHNLGRAKMALPNGYCGLPLQQTCPHANACLDCPVFVTTPEFLGQHRQQLVTTEQLIARPAPTGTSAWSR